MERELKDANDLVEASRKKAHLALSEEAIESLSPSAARASSLLKSGMTLTQVKYNSFEIGQTLLLSCDLRTIYENGQKTQPTIKICATVFFSL